jgi:glucose/arabinose dehydrogenase
MDFDPVTGKLWDTENGPAFGDEINIVEPGFNSGWVKIMGLAKDDLTKSKADPARDLVNFDGKGKYRDPEFVWTQPVAPTALKFFNSNKLGKQYQNDMFVGDVNIGNIYHFKLNQQRTGLLLDGPLADKDADNAQEIEKVTFGTGFGGITDIQVGPDGYLYILTIQGTIFRIVPSSLA